jgi:hypothetical protein
MPTPVRTDPAAGAGPRWRAVGRLAAAVALIVVAALALSAPQFLRVYATFGNPLGPGHVRETLAMQRHDPGSIVVNSLRIAHTALEVPAPPVNRWTGDRVIGLAHLLGRDPGDPRTTFYGQVFPDESWYPHEDKAALPLHALLLLIGAGAAVLRSARAGGDRRLLAYVGALTVALVAYAVIFKWQPWGNRLLLFAVVAAGPLAGAWLHGVLGRGSGRAWARHVTVATVVVATCAGLLSAAYGYPRRLVGSDSALVRSDLDARFAIRPGWLGSYERAAAAVNATGARRVGVVLAHDTWEYPWHYLLTARDLRSLQSPAPEKLPPASASEIEAMVCSGPFWYCRPFAPPGWAYTQDGDIAWAIPVRP